MSKSAKLIIAAIVFLIYGFVVIHSGWTGSAKHHEDRLQASASAKLAALNLDNVRVEMDGQSARVTGMVRSRAERDRVIDAVRRARWSGGIMSGGVTVVNTDRLRVQETAATPAGPFIWTAEKTDDGPMVLSGVVPDEVTREELLAYANEIYPAGAIDRMSIARGAPGGDWLAAASNSLSVLIQLNRGRARGNGSAFSISGRARDEDLAGALRRQTANQMPEGFRGTANISIMPKPTVQSPYTVGIEMPKGRGAIRISGFAPDRETADAILDHGRARFAGRRVIDQLVIASGAPQGDWVGSLKVGIDQLALLEFGDLKAEDLSIRLTGEATDDAIADAVQTGLRNLRESNF